ncbi:MAG: hypothetical protein JWQ56_1262 [Pseudarthrobacter sp.]|nr:hypothetical protein [Pseudarthrobacter sp.]
MVTDGCLERLSAGGTPMGVGVGRLLAVSGVVVVVQRGSFIWHLHLHLHLHLYRQRRTLVRDRSPSPRWAGLAGGSAPPLSPGAGQVHLFTAVNAAATVVGKGCTCCAEQGGKVATCSAVVSKTLDWRQPEQ